MYIMYVDESGDCGMVDSPTRFFVLSGLVVHELRWHACLDQLIDFRRRMRETFGLKLPEEIHAAAYLTRPGPLVRIKKNDRLTILRFFAKELASMTNFSAINVVIDKEGKPDSYDVFEHAWQALIQRFENTILHRNFPGPMNPDERGLLMPDDTDTKKLQRLLRRMRRYNPIPRQAWAGPGYRDLPLTSIVEDPSFRRSVESYFRQAADLIAFLLYQKHTPNAHIREKGAVHYFDRLDPILCRAASSSDSRGVVRL